MKNWTTIAITALLAAACGDEPEAKPPIIRPVRYAVVKSDDGARQRTFSGTVRAGNQTRMSFQVPGRVNQVAVKVGDRVTKNQMVARLDPTDFDLQLREARASAAQAQAQARSALAGYDRVRKLYENQNASRQDLDNARAQRDTSRSAASAASQAVRRLGRQLEYAKLTAPAGGTISDVLIEANEVVGAGQVVAVLQVGEQLEVAVEVPESAINRIRRGDSVSVGLDAVDAPVQGTVYEVGVPANGGAAFPVTVRLGESTPDKVRAGMAAVVNFAFKQSKEQASRRLLPATAVGEDRVGRFVYVVEDSGDGFGKVKRTAVEVGDLVDQRIELLSGVADGQMVVTAGVSRIRDGLKVKVPPVEGAAPPPAKEASSPKAAKAPTKPGADTAEAEAKAKTP